MSSTASNNQKIVIGIPTFRRPKSLRRLLESIALQRVDYTVHVIVADNDSLERGGIQVVDDMLASGFPFAITGIVVENRGISHARNALMDVAFKSIHADALAMVDDDEIVEPSWLSSLVSMQNDGGFDVVGGSVYPEFEVEPPTWTRSLTIYWRRVHNSGPIDIINGTTNVLVARSVYDFFPSMRFDESFSLTGGGDKDFFTRLKRKGARFGFSRDAVSHEFFGSSRLTRRWALQRAYRIGSGDARVMKAASPTAGAMLNEFFRISAGVVGAPIMMIAKPWSSSWQMKMLLVVARQFGKINGFMGTPPRVYAEIHGK